MPVEVQRRFWREVAAGLSVVEAAGAAGVSRPTGQRMFSRCGGVMPSLAEPSGSYRLNLPEREEIACLRAAGAGVRAIARQLGRDPGTISRELARNARARGGYRASTAQAATDHRARRGKPAKLATNLSLRREVQRRLTKNHSPEQIDKRLREDFPDDPEMWVSHETIYQSIFVQGRGGLKRELARHLRTGRSLRKPRRQAEARRGRGERIKDMINISERPPEAQDRAVPGHWEGDLIVGAANGSAIGTLVERTTRFTLLLHLDDQTAATVRDAIEAAITTLPTALRRSLTWDQGAEMAQHAQLRIETGLAVYFCDPHSPWQRGTNENTNGLLRQYFPKGTDLSKHTRGDLDAVAAALNSRPRKTLGWRTPAEALNEQLLLIQRGGVATTP